MCATFGMWFAKKTEYKPIKDATMRKFMIVLAAVVASLGCSAAEMDDTPIKADALPSAEYGFEGQALHAKILGFIHPRTKEYMEFSSTLPEEFLELLAK